MGSRMRDGKLRPLRRRRFERCGLAILMTCVLAPDAGAFGPGRAGDDAKVFFDGTFAKNIGSVLDSANAAKQPEHRTSQSGEAASVPSTSAQPEIGETTAPAAETNATAVVGSPMPDLGAPPSSATAADQPSDSGSAESPPPPVPAPDYYAVAAQKVLAEEEKNAGKPHPLQLAAPDYDVLVCEAGCRTPGPLVLSKQLKSAAVSTIAEPDGTARRPAMVTFSTGAECLGGCYGGSPGVMEASFGRDRGATGLLEGAAGTWMTTVSPGDSEASASPAAVSTPAAKKATAEDWMARINRERAAKASQPKS